MTEQDAFLRAICETPHDDAPRLIYADWLEERGQVDRAEFIRVQCELTKRKQEPCFYNGGPWPGSPPALCCLPGCKKCWAIDRLGFRELELLHSGAFDLWKTFCPWGRATWTMTLHAREPAFRIGKSEAEQNIWHYLCRGFVGGVRCTWPDWYGGPCEHCNGAGRLNWYAAVGSCSYCTGTGRVGGHGPVIVRQQPIEFVRVSDKSPLTRPGVHLNSWWNAAALTDHTYSPQSILPAEVFSLLPGSGYVRKQFNTTDAAHAALSTALITHARLRAISSRQETAAN